MHPEREMAASKEDIDACDNIAALIEMYDQADDMGASVRANIEARDLADISDDEWFFRASDKFGFCQVAKGRIVKRLFRLGYDGRLEPDHASTTDMRLARRDIHDLKTRVNAIEKAVGIGNERREASRLAQATHDKGAN